MNEATYREAEMAFWSAHGLEPSERFVRLAVTGSRVRVLEVGAGEPVLFVHGGPNAGSTWVPLLQHLPGHRCLLVDRPGTGLSEPFAVNAANFAEFGSRFVGEVLDGVGVERSHVVASSFGGHLALRSAAHDPGRFLRMVQMGCPALVPGDSLPPFMRMISNPVTRRLAPMFPPNPRVGAAILRQMGHGTSLDAGRISTEFRTWSMDLQRYTDTLASDFEMLASILRNAERSRLTRESLAMARVPTLFLWGADDTFGGEAVARDLVRAMPDARLESLPASGHLPWIDDPLGLARRTAGFLSGRTPPPLDLPPSQATVERALR